LYIRDDDCRRVALVRQEQRFDEFGRFFREVEISFISLKRDLSYKDIKRDLYFYLSGRFAQTADSLTTEAGTAEPGSRAQPESI
jgi:hypothetical protein